MNNKTAANKKIQCKFLKRRTLIDKQTVVHLTNIVGKRTVVLSHPFFKTSFISYELSPIIALCLNGIATRNLLQEINFLK